MLVRKLLAVITTFIVISGAHAQNKKLIDSLERRIATGKRDTLMIDLLNALAFEYRSYDVSKAFSLLDRSIKLSKELDHDPGIALAYNHLGILHKNKQEFEEALKYHNLALNLRKKLNDKGGMASSYNNLGVTYDAKGDFENAMQSYLRSLRMREETKDTAGMSAAYNNISRIYAQKSNKKLAMQYNLKALQLREKTGDSFMVARYCGLQGFLHYELNEYEPALAYFNRALAIYKTVGDVAESSLLLNNIGNILVEKGQIDEGIRHHTDALKIQQEIGDTSSIFTSTLSLAQAYGFKENYSEALKYGALSQALLKGSGTGVKMLMDYYQVMGEIYKKKGDYKNAIEANTEYNRYKDSLISSENNAVVTEMQVKYETERKDLELAHKTLALNRAGYELQKRNAVAIGLVVLMVLLAAVGYLSYSRYKLKKRKELDAEIIRQQEMRSKAIIEAEEKERIRIAKDLHDGVGQQLSAVKLRLSMLRNDRETFEDNCRTLVQMVDDAVKEVRGVSHDMMPNALLRSGLAAATREFIDKIAGTGLLKVDLQIIGLNERLDGTTETILYRVLQESVNNIIKHANASKVSIQLIKDENELSLVLEDNGRGFDVEKINSFPGIGLKNIISRIEYLNGKVNFDSAIGKGTTMIVEVPLNAAA